MYMFVTHTDGKCSTVELDGVAEMTAEDERDWTDDHLTHLSHDLQPWQRLSSNLASVAYKQDVSRCHTRVIYERMASCVIYILRDSMMTKHKTKETTHVNYVMLHFSRHVLMQTNQ